MPRLTLRQQDIDGMHAEFPVAEVRIYVAEEDWEPFLAIAYQGMEIPVRVEGREDGTVAVLTRADPDTKSIVVVI